MDQEKFNTIIKELVTKTDSHAGKLEVVLEHMEACPDLQREYWVGSQVESIPPNCGHDECWRNNSFRMGMMYGLLAGAACERAAQSPPSPAAISRDIRNLDADELQRLAKKLRQDLANARKSTQELLVDVIEPDMEKRS